MMTMGQDPDSARTDAAQSIKVYTSVAKIFVDDWDSIVEKAMIKIKEERVANGD
jgi:hypothetical protein